jgi:rubrerythrin
MDKKTLDALLATAIAREVEANTFYRGVAERSTDPAVKEIFTGLAVEELGHREYLETISGDPQILGCLEAPEDDYGVAEATELAPLTFDMKPADAFALAMKKEQRAAEFYTRLARSATDPGVKEAFEGLANMEKRHKTRLEGLFVQVGYPEVF